MNVSVVRESLFIEKKQHRKDKKLCLYCEQLNHLILSCLNSKRNKRLQIAEINVAFVSSFNFSFNFISSSSSSVESKNEVFLN